MKPILGGCVVCRPSPIDLKIGAEQGLTLLSDLHIGAPNINYRLIEKELKDARRRNDRILINGDVFDGILHSDAKRFSPDCIHPRLHGRRDVLNSAIEWAVDLLQPYADLIDVIGIGNHETALEKHHSIDPVRVLCYDLTRKLARPCQDHVIHYGGYKGFVDYRLGGLRWVLYYYHGKGHGQANSTKDFENESLQVENVGAIWLGHKHQSLASGVERISCPMGGYNCLVSVVRYIRTGAYMKVNTGQSQASIRKYGRRSNYAADSSMKPGMQGGARIVLKRKRWGIETKVEQ